MASKLPSFYDNNYTLLNAKPRKAIG